MIDPTCCLVAGHSLLQISVSGPRTFSYHRTKLKSSSRENCRAGCGSHSRLETTQTVIRLRVLEPAATTDAPLNAALIHVRLDINGTGLQVIVILGPRFSIIYSLICRFALNLNGGQGCCHILENNVRQLSVYTVSQVPGCSLYKVS